VGKSVGIGAGVLVDNDARVVATASSTGKRGVVVFVGREHDVKINSNKIIKKYLMHRLYSFSEQIDCVDVNWVKE
jgi:hypothetical protein